MTPDTMQAFYRAHDLSTWADAIAGHPSPGPEDASDFEAAAVFPPVALQQADSLPLIEAMTRPHADLDAAHQYGGYWVRAIEDLAQCDILDRPEGPYTIWMKPGAFPTETTNLTCSRLVKDFSTRQWTGLTVHEFLVIQRLQALAHGDHRWSRYHGSETHPAGHQWLPNARLGKKVFQGYWVAKSGQVQIGACATGSKKASRGAHPCLVTPL